ncbi:MAG: gamma-glutamyltransferase [Proteobacteria bacterium]|nr:gamma-glutamyltransferase [Pseudomonadota bacterium]
MRDFQLPGRSPVYALNGMAATSQPMATSVAVDVLRGGGNAMDAAVAACAVLCVVEPQSTGIGGDCFVLYAPGGGDAVIAYNGSGRAPQAASADWFLERGIDAIDPLSAHAVTVPGAIDAWTRLIADHGRTSLDQLLQPAIDCAENGYVVHPRVAADWHAAAGKLSRDETAARIFLPGGKSPPAGAVHRQPELAGTLRRIAAEGRDGFYAGPVAEDIVGMLRARGGLHTLDDFAAAAGEYMTPIHTGYRGLDIFECPPNGQGITPLIMLNVLAGYPLSELDPLGVERLHLEIEAGRLAFCDRDALVADPAQSEVPVARLLSSGHADELRARIRRDRALTGLPPPAFPAHHDTVYLCVVDRDRNAVSFINTLFASFGSGLMSPKTGVVLHNRGFGFVIEPGHPNCIAPGKRPLHTIIPGMALDGGRVAMTFGVKGAHYQPFGHVHFLTNVIDYGMDLQAALDAPRVFRYGEICEVERGIPRDSARGLEALGHQVEIAKSPLGGGQAIRIDWTNGVLTGGSDPRKDGCALGY